MVLVHDAAAAYGNYFAVMQKISQLLTQGIDVLASDRNKSLVEIALKDTLNRLAYTGNALHNKYAFTHASLTGEKLRIAPSGFPVHVEITDMVMDLVNRDKNIGQLVDVETQKEAWLNQAALTLIDDADLLWRIGERTYLNLLDVDSMLLPIVTGDIEYRGMSDDGERMYAFWWTCYSTRDHCPCVHVLEFTQDVSDSISPMHEEGPSKVAFLQTIRSRGQRNASVSIMASDIDFVLPYIHPKRLVRLTFEQLFTAALVEHQSDDLPEMMSAKTFFASQAARADDVLLVFSRDIVVSKGSKVNPTITLGRNQRLEIYNLDGADPRAYERGATLSSKFVVVPHRYLQFAQTEEGSALQHLLQDAEMKLVYSKEGTLNAII